MLIRPRTPPEEEGCSGGPGLPSLPYILQRARMMVRKKWWVFISKRKVDFPKCRDRSTSVHGSKRDVILHKRTSAIVDHPHRAVEGTRRPMSNETGVTQNRNARTAWFCGAATPDTQTTNTPVRCRGWLFHERRSAAPVAPAHGLQ
jgi:hypothetical protein